MSLIDITIFILVFLLLSTFSFNLKAAKLTTDCYYPMKTSLKLIMDYKVKSSNFLAMRLEMADALGLMLTPREKKISLFTKILITLYQPLFKRVGLEQSAVNRWFLEAESKDNGGLFFKHRQVGGFYTFIISLVTVGEGVRYSEIERLYFAYRIVLGINKRLGATDFEIIISKPMLDKMFLKVDKTKFSSKEIKRIVSLTVAAAKEANKVKVARYEASLLLKSMCFLHPSFKQSPKFKSFTNN